jgi:hypothetical protein
MAILWIVQFHFILKLQSDKHSILCCEGASIRAARACNRHIVALESDSKLFNEVLKPLVAPQIRTTPPPTTPIQLDDDDEDTLPDEPFDKICE